MRILVASDVFPPKSGGSGWSTFYLARALLERGHTVQVVLPVSGAAGVQRRAFEGVPVAEVGYTASALPGVRAWERTRALERTLGGYLAERAAEFDVIHAQHILTIGAAAAARDRMASTGRVIPIVSTVREYWHVCLYGTLWRDGAICPICRGGELTRCLAQKYGTRARWMQPVVPLVERELERRRRILAASDKVIAVSEFVAETLRGIVPPERLAVVPNLIDVTETRAQAEGGASLRGGQDYLVFIGKLNALKGADLLPQILKESGVNLPLVVVGAGELEGVLAKTPGIELRGWLSNRETLQILAKAKALIFPSRWAEPLARTLLEAQALGIPAVACNNGGTRDIIESNFNGVLAETTSELAMGVRRVVTDPVLHARLSENARRVANSRFSPATIVPQLENIYSGTEPHYFEHH